jgi:hypothetical protein
MGRMVLRFGVGVNERIQLAVMAGLVPAIHVFPCFNTGKTWMPGKSPGMTTSVRVRRRHPHVAIGGSSRLIACG